LEFAFGATIFEALSEEISQEFLKGKIGVRTAIIHKPELFERAFIEILGEMGERILGCIWNSELRSKFSLDINLGYHEAGDLAKCIGALHARGNRISP
jgi:hypothetical protein